MIDCIKLPRSNNSKEVIDFPVTPSIVITGANGSGKTRLGAWLELESSQNNIVRRISAQKSLSMPDFSQTSAMEEAESALMFGYQDFKQVEKNPSLNALIRFPFRTLQKATQ